MGSLENFRKALRPLGAVAGLTGVTALLNRSLRDGALPLDHLGGTRRPWRWRGYDIFVTELGAGPPILLVHGIYAGASSFEYRALAPLLARNHRVIAFDLLGCGLSEMPAVAYAGELFVELVADALGALACESATVVGSSLGGAFAIRAALRVPERVNRLVTIVPTGLHGVLDAEPSAPQRALGALLRSPVAGEAAFNALSAKSALRRYLRARAYAGAAHVTPALVAHYHAVTHQPGARYVPAAFAGGALNIDVARDLPFLETPLLVVWGEDAAAPSPVAGADEFVRLARDARLVTLPRAGLLPHEEAPHGVARAILDFAKSGA